MADCGRWLAYCIAKNPDQRERLEACPFVTVTYLPTMKLPWYRVSCGQLKACSILISCWMLSRSSSAASSSTTCAEQHAQGEARRGEARRSPQTTTMQKRQEWPRNEQKSTSLIIYCPSRLKRSTNKWSVSVWRHSAVV